MARKARVRSQNGVYYIDLSGNPPLYTDAVDAGVFLDALKREHTDDFAEIYAYCLLNDKIYLIIKEGLSGISKNIMRLLSFYTGAYNKRHNLKGALFRGRFYSSPLEDDTLILRATRAVHRLPLQYGEKLDFEYSSYKHMFKKDSFLSGDALFLMAGGIIDFKLFTES